MPFLGRSLGARPVFWGLGVAGSSVEWTPASSLAAALGRMTDGLCESKDHDPELLIAECDTGNDGSTIIYFEVSYLCGRGNPRLLVGFRGADAGAVEHLLASA